MKVYNAIYILMFALIICTGIVSAFGEVSTAQGENSSQVTVKSWYDLPLISSSVADLNLTTPHVNHVMPGDSIEIGQFNVYPQQDWANAIQGTKAYNLNDAGKEIQKTFVYKELSYTTATRDTYNFTTNLVQNGTLIKKWGKNGTEEYQDQIWTDVDASTFKTDVPVTIGVFTDVKEGDYFEWIPNLFNADITQWAIVVGDANFRTYLSFDENTGITAFNSVTNTMFNATLDNSNQWNATVKKLGTSALSIRKGIISNINGNVNLASTWSIGWWMYRDSGGLHWAITQPTGGLYTSYNSDAMTCGVRGTGEISTATNTTVNVWDFFICTANGNNWTIYKNGVQAANGVVTSYSGSGLLHIGRADNDNTGEDSNFTIDESFVYNRTLTAAEASQYYNASVGLNPFTIVSAVQVNVTSLTPVNNTNVSANTFLLNASINVTSGSYDNATAELYYTNGTLYKTNTSTENPFIHGIQISGVADGTYLWNIRGYANDSVIVNNVSSTNRTINVDATIPVVSFGTTTDNSTEIIERSNIIINVSASDAHFANLTIYLYNSSNSLVNQQNSTTTPKWVNITSLPDGVYFFNASAYDSFNNIGYSETRNVTVDIADPAISFQSPTLANNSIVSASFIEVNVSGVLNLIDLDSLNITLVNATNSLINSSQSTSSPLYRNYSSLSDGVYFFNATRKSLVNGNAYTTTRMITLDRTAPNIAYGSRTETNASTISRSNIIINVTASDVNTYTLNVSLFNSTGLVNATASSSSPNYLNITSLPDGVYFFNASAYDSVGNTNYTATYSVTIDTSAPNITIVHPVNQSNYNLATYTGQLNYTVSGSNIAFCWYSINGGTTNTSVACGTNLTGLTNNQYSLANNWLVAANNTAGTQRMASLSFNALTDNPKFITNTPANGTVYASRSVSLSTIANESSKRIMIHSGSFGALANGTIVLPANVSFMVNQSVYSAYCWYNDSSFDFQHYQCDNLQDNTNGTYTVATGITAAGVTTCSAVVGQNNYCASVFTLSLTLPNTDLDGDYLWNATVTDLFGNVNITNSSYFTLDFVGPMINITAPVNLTEFITTSLPLNITVNYTASDPHLGVCMVGNGTTQSIVSCGTNTTILTSVKGYTPVNLTVNDTVGGTSTQTNFAYVNLISEKLNFSNPGVEGENFTATFNLTATNISTITNVNLYYNNTAYAMSQRFLNGTFASYTANITAISQTSVSLFASYILDGFARNTASYNQSVTTVTPVIVSSSCTDKAMNFTIYDEKNFSIINATIAYNFQYGITNGHLKAAFGSIDSTNNFYLCINATIGNYTLGSGEIDYTGVDGYVERRYYTFTDHVVNNNTLENVSLYDLTASSATSFLVSAQDNTLTPYVGKYLGLLRWYPNFNTYNLVEMAQTDATGSSIMRMKVEDVDYRVALWHQNGTLIKLNDVTRFACLTQPCTYSFTVIVGDNDFTSSTGIQQSLVFNETTNKFLYVWNDPSQKTSSMNLTVYRETGIAVGPICTSVGSGFTGAVSCDVSGYTGQLNAVVARNTASADSPIDSLIYTIGQGISNVASDMGLFIAMGLAIAGFFIGIFNPVIGIIMLIAALVPSVYLGATTISVVIGFGVAGIVVIHFMRRIF